jgi:hypothetical protein
MKNKTLYYVGAAVAAYFIYQWWKNKQVPASPAVTDQSGTVTTVTPQLMTTSTSPLSVVDSLKSLLQSPAEIPVQQPDTYQTFYGNISGVEVKKVPYSC